MMGHPIYRVAATSCAEGTTTDDKPTDVEFGHSTGTNGTTTVFCHDLDGRHLEVDPVDLLRALVISVEASYDRLPSLAQTAWDEAKQELVAEQRPWMDRVRAWNVDNDRQPPADETEFMTRHYPTAAWVDGGWFDHTTATYISVGTS